MKKPPCIRGLREFRKGCPQRAFNGEDGCPAWIEKTLPGTNGTKIEVRECLDLYMARLHWSTNGLLEGNQQAIETFRNNMTVDGSPRPDPLLVGLITAATGNDKTIPHKTHKELTHGIDRLD